MPRIQVSGVGLFFEQAGCGPNIVLIHGLGANLAFWYFDLMPKLAADFRVTAFDLRGHGRSDMPAAGYTTAHMAWDLLGLLDALGISRAHLVGHSFGGAVALHGAVLFPRRVKSLTIADSRVRALQRTVRLKDWAHWGEWARRAAYDETTFTDDQEIDFRLLERLAQHRMRPRDAAASMGIYRPFEMWGGRRTARRWLKLLSTTAAKLEFEAIAGLTPGRIARLALPVDAVYGEYSFCLPTCRWLERNLTRVSVTIVPEAGHFHPVVKPTFFNSRLRCFLLAQEGMAAVGGTAEAAKSMGEA